MTMDPRFGRTTVVKLLGGELLVKEAGTTTLAMRRRLEGIRRRALDLRAPFSRFRDVWLTQTERVFAAEGLPVRWPPLQPAYAAWKAIHFPGQPMMRRTDRLYASLTQPGNPDMIWEVTPRTIRYGTRVPYWKYTQDKRPTLILTPSTFKILHRFVMEHLRG